MPYQPRSPWSTIRPHKVGALAFAGVAANCEVDAGSRAAASVLDRARRRSSRFAAGPEIRPFATGVAEARRRRAMAKCAVAPKQFDSGNQIFLRLKMPARLTDPTSQRVEDKSARGRNRNSVNKRG